MGAATIDNVATTLTLGAATELNMAFGTTAVKGGITFGTAYAKAPLTKWFTTANSIRRVPPASDGATVGRVDETGHAEGTSFRFAISFDPGPPPTVTKRGDRDALAREAQALIALAGHDWLPTFIHHEPGRLVTEWLPGSPRQLSSMAPADARALGVTLRAVHRSVPGTDLCVSTPGGYARSRAEAVRRMAQRAELEHEVAVPDPARTLVPIHGDLVEANIIWGLNAPVLIDWEFWRQGDPAEDLAYLVALNDLPQRVTDDVASGYGTDEPWARVAAWRPIVTLEAAAWYRLAGDTDRADALLRG